MFINKVFGVFDRFELDGAEIGMLKNGDAGPVKREYCDSLGSPRSCVVGELVGVLGLCIAFCVESSGELSSRPLPFLLAGRQLPEKRDCVVRGIDCGGVRLKGVVFDLSASAFDPSRAVL